VEEKMILEKKELSTGKLLLLVFLPATLVLVLSIGALNFRNAVPPLLSWILIMTFVLLPFELYVILCSSKKIYGKYSLKSAFIYNDKIAPLKLLLIAIIPFCIAVAMATLIGNVETQYMTSTVFKFVPAYFKLEDFTNQTTQYPPTTILLTCILYVVANVFVLPVVEELYFRGYLMPRIERFGKFAPIIITVLFSLYHFWAPWSNIMRILAIFPFTYAVWKNKNIYIGIMVHCAINIGSSAGMLYAVYGVH
jgi:membrane protease YdiL (CAAX protease family)